MATKILEGDLVEGDNIVVDINEDGEALLSKDSRL